MVDMSLAQLDGELSFGTDPMQLSADPLILLHGGRSDRPSLGDRLVDAAHRLLALVGLLLLLPMGLLLALAIRIGDPGPILFRQVRVGLEGQEFVLFKFRTMRIGAESLLDQLRDPARPPDLGSRAMAASLLPRRAAAAVERRPW
jgi:hypothetical protein